MSAGEGLLAGVIGGLAGAGKGVMEVGENEQKANIAKTLREQEAEIQQQRDLRQQEYQSGEAEKGRVFSSTQTDKDRTFRTSEREAGNVFTKGEHDLDRAARKEEGDRSHALNLKKFAADERSANQRGGLISAQTEEAKLAAQDKAVMRGLRSSLAEAEARGDEAGSQAAAIIRKRISALGETGEAESYGEKTEFTYDELGNKTSELKTKVRAASPDSKTHQPAPPSAIDYLKKNPGAKDQFKQKYGYLPEGF